MTCLAVAHHSTCDAGLNVILHATSNSAIVMQARLCSALHLHSRRLSSVLLAVQWAVQLLSFSELSNERLELGFVRARMRMQQAAVPIKEERRRSSRLESLLHSERT